MELRLADALQKRYRKTVAKLRFEQGRALRDLGKPLGALYAYRMAANAYRALGGSAGYALAVRETDATLAAEIRLL